ncbi:MAG: sigma-70 family RNA polymerase sigma factor [Phycisphaerae bacterium]
MSNPSNPAENEVPIDGSRDIGLSDEELVARAQQGDRAAFAELMLRYQDRIYNSVYRMCRDAEDASDMTQTTFLRALQALPRFESRASVYTWLFRIAMNLTISLLRSRKRVVLSLQHPDQNGQERDLPDGRETSSADELDRAALMRKVEAALEQVDADFRAAVVLRDIEGLDYATIGSILELPVGTVKSRIHRGRLLIREIVTRETHARDAAKFQSG